MAGDTMEMGDFSIFVFLIFYLSLFKDLTRSKQTFQGRLRKTEGGKNESNKDLHSIIERIEFDFRDCWTEAQPRRRHLTTLSNKRSRWEKHDRKVWTDYQ